MSSERTPDVTDAASATDHWTTLSRRVVNSYVEVNNAFLAAMGVPGATGSTSDERQSSAPSGVESVAYDDASWSIERSADDLAALGVGDYVRFTKPLEETDLSAFARASGDTNRLHLDDEFASDTRFDGRIAHGTLVSGTISAALARLPGTTIYLSQDLEFQGPVEVGDVVTADCRIVESLGDDRYRLHTEVTTADDERVIDGEAVVIVSDEPDE